MRFMLNWLFTSIAIAIATFLVPGIQPFGFAEAWVCFAFVGLFLNIVDSLVKPFLTVISLPLTIITLGIFQLVVNSFMLELASYLSVNLLGAGISIAKLLLQFGAGNIVLVDRAGAVSVDEDWLNPAQRKMAEITNRHNERGSLADVMKGKDVFIGVSAPKIVTAEMVSTMAKDAIVFAMANPTPEIMPEEAAKGGARVIATGRSDYPNQINNVLVFPGIFRGALDAQATDITEEMKLSAARAIASIVSDDELKEDYIIPGAFDKRVAPAVAKAVMDCAKASGISKLGK